MLYLHAKTVWSFQSKQKRLPLSMSINEFNKPWVIQEGIRPWVLHLGDSLPGSNAMFERLCFFQRRGGDQVVFAVSVCSKCRDLHSLDVDCWQVWHLLQTKRTMSQRGELERCAERFAMYWYFANANGIFVSTNIFPLSTSVLRCFKSCLYVLPCPSRAWGPDRWSWPPFTP